MYQIETHVLNLLVTLCIAEVLFFLFYLLRITESAKRLSQALDEFYSHVVPHVAMGKVSTCICGVYVCFWPFFSSLSAVKETYVTR